MATRSLYVEPDSNAAKQATAWRTSDPTGAGLMDIIAKRPQAMWLGEWSGDVATTVDKAVTAGGSKLRVFVVYYIPQRDGSAYSAGGAPDTTSYWSFVAGVARGLKRRPAIIVLEPDALCHVDFLSADDLAKRLRLLAAAVDTLVGAGATVYLDAGDSNWIPASTVGPRLQAAGVARARGFALNVSHVERTEDEHAYAAELRAIVGTSARYIVDTSRNGQGPAPDNEWCNPPGRGLGKSPTLSTGVSYCDAFLWVKRPGESDGECNGGPAPGTWWASYARGLAERAVL